MLFLCDLNPEAGEFTAKLVAFSFGNIVKHVWRNNYVLRLWLRILFNFVTWCIVLNVHALLYSFTCCGLILFYGQVEILSYFAPRRPHNVPV